MMRNATADNVVTGLAWASAPSSRMAMSERLLARLRLGTHMMAPLSPNLRSADSNDR